jgi:hypothetical protein
MPAFKNGQRRATNKFARSPALAKGRLQVGTSQVGVPQVGVGAVCVYRGGWAVDYQTPIDGVTPKRDSPHPRKTRERVTEAMPLGNLEIHHEFVKPDSIWKRVASSF